MINCITTDMIVPMALGMLAILALVTLCLSDEICRRRDRRRAEKFFKTRYEYRFKINDGENKKWEK